MIIRTSILAACLASGLFLTLAKTDAQISKTSRGYTMKMKWVKGQSMTYIMNTKMTGTKQQIPDMKMPMKMRVTDVTNGVATIQTAVGPFGKGGKATETTVKIDSTGRPVGGNNQMMSSFGAAGFPKHPIKIGESWKSSLPVQTPMGSMNVVSVYRFKGVNRIGGKEVADLDVRISGASKGMSLSGGGTMTLFTSDASLARANFNQNISMSGKSSGQGMNMKMNISIVRK